VREGGQRIEKSSACGVGQGKGRKFAMSETRTLTLLAGCRPQWPVAYL
jgi:hypothetical protein